LTWFAAPRLLQKAWWQWRCFCRWHVGTSRRRADGVLRVPCVITDYLFPRIRDKGVDFMSGYLEVSRGAKGRRVYKGQLNPRPGGPSTDNTHSMNPPCPAFFCIRLFILPYLESSTDRLTSWKRTVPCGHSFILLVRLGEYHFILFSQPVKVPALGSWNVFSRSDNISQAERMTDFGFFCLNRPRRAGRVITSSPN
jgi:hypothetical protein